MISGVVAILYGIVLVICLFLTAIAAVVWLCLKQPAKAICGNVLIVVSTVTALLTYLSVPVSNYIVERNEIAIPENAGTAGDSIVTRADAIANAFEKAEAADLIKTELPFLNPFAQFLALPTQSEARDSVTSFFDKLSSVDKRRVRIIERQNIFEHEFGLPFNKESDKEISKHRSSRYGRRFIAFIRSVDKPLPADELAEAVNNVYSNLPAGFYRDSLLKAIYTSAKDEKQLTLITTAHKKNVRERMQKMLVGIALSYAIIFAGVVVLIVFATSKWKSAYSSIELPVLEISLRQIYCFALLVYYTQFGLSFPVGIAGAMVPKFGAFLKAEAIAVTSFTLGLNLILIVLCAKWTIFNPLELKTIPTIKKLFGGNIINAALLGTGACCAGKALITLFYWLAYAIFQHIPSTNNVVSDQIASVAMNPDAVKLVLLLMMASVFAPLGEELAFRGLLYTSINRKFGVLAGIIVSSAIFAAYHMDPGSFMGLFAIGVGLAFLFTRTKSLLPSVFMHGMWNASLILIAWFLT